MCVLNMKRFSLHNTVHVYRCGWFKEYLKHDHIECGCFFIKSNQSLVLN